MLIKRTANEVVFSGASLGIEGFKIDTGSFSNKLIELVQATQVAVGIDNFQYLLCKETANMKDDDPLKNDYKRMRLQLILAFNQLQGILGTIREQPTEELKKELSEWVKYMNELNKQCITFLQPGPRFTAKGAKSKLGKVMKYQGIDDNQLDDAIKLL